MASIPAPATRGWYHGWNIVGVCVLAGMAASALPVNAFSLFLPQWSRDLHTPFSTLTLGIAAMGFACSALSPIIGGLADRYPARWLFLAGLIGVAAFCFGISMMTAGWQIIPLYALFAAALVLSTSVPANAVVSRWFLHRRGLALGLTAFGLSLAGIVMPPILGAVIPLIGWRATWQISGAITLLVILPLLLLVLRERPGERDGSKYVPTGAADAGGHHGDAGVTWGDILKNPTFWVLIATFLPMMAVNGAVAMTNLVPIVSSRGIGAGTASVLLSLVSVGQVGATLGGGILSDKFGNRLPLASLGFLTAIGGLLAAYSSNVLVLGVAFTLIGMGGGFWPLVASAVARAFGAGGVGRAFGSLVLFLPLTAFAPFSVAKSQEVLGSYGPAILGLSALAALGGIICLLFLRERPLPTT
jgi:MFS family permease